MMGSLYLNGLNKEAKAALQQQLWDSQGGKCFISGKPIDLALMPSGLNIIEMIKSPP